MEKTQFTKYETARILGARALQIAMNAPLLIKFSQEDLEKIHFDALKIAEVELNSGVLPITVNEPLPPRKEDKLRRAKGRQISDEKIEQQEREEEEEIVREGEIMELANTDDDDSDEEDTSEEQ